MRSASNEVETLTRTLASRYPEPLRQKQLADTDRIAFNIGLMASMSRRVGGRVCDIGGGIGLFSLVSASLGFETILIDDFDDAVNHEFGMDILDIHRSAGVTVIERDVIEKGLPESLPNCDVITTFDAIEHWHHSPKALFGQVANRLRGGGGFVLSAPNCANLRKRITVPLGRGKWSAMSSWYESPRFRGHVREPDVDDLRYIARDLGLESAGILGRNWLGHASESAYVRSATSSIDRLIQRFPSLCSDIYLVGKIP